MSAGFAHILQDIALYITLIGVQFLLGKKAVFPYGLIMGFSPLTIGVVVTICDLALMVFVDYLFDNASRLLKFKKLLSRYIADENKLIHSKRFKLLQKFGRMGVVIIVAIPCAGGVWSGAFLANLLSLNKTDYYWTIALGSALGALIFVLSFMGLTHWVL